MIRRAYFSHFVARDFVLNGYFAGAKINLGYFFFHILDVRLGLQLNETISVTREADKNCHQITRISPGPHNRKQQQQMQMAESALPST